MGEFISQLSAFEMIYDGGMIAWALCIFIMLMGVSKRLHDIAVKTEKAYSSAKSETKIDAAGNAVQDVSMTFNREKHEPIRAEFTELAVKYIKWANLISTLTIAGLLGTVIGLIPGLTAVKSQDLEVLYSSLSTALSSTVIGLLAALILKIYVSVGPDSQVNKVEMLFDQIDRRYDIAIGAGKVTK